MTDGPRVLERPRRHQIRRTKGYRKPEGAVYVGRPSKWGNPYPVKQYGEVAVEMFDSIEFRKMAESLDELRGKDLLCWCRPGEVCHADVLIDLANRTSDDG